MRVFGSRKDNIIRQRLKIAIGEKNFNDLMTTVEDEVVKGQVFGEMFGGSQTAEKEALKASVSLSEMANRAINVIRQKIGKSKQTEIAKLLLSPELLKKELLKTKFINPSSIKVLSNVKTNDITKLLVDPKFLKQKLQTITPQQQKPFIEALLSVGRGIKKGQPSRAIGQISGTNRE